MPYGTMDRFVEAFRDSAGPASEIDASDLQPRLHPVTLSFRQVALERDYLNAMRRQTAAVVRFGILLALIVYLLFGALDLWVATDHISFTWTIRSLLFLATIVLFGLSFTPLFVEYRESFMLPFCLLLGVGVTAILLVVPPDAIDRYYVGYMLIITGAYTVLGLRFFNATLVAALLLVSYIAVEIQGAGEIAGHALNNLAFLVSTLTISAVGGYIYERQRRLAHYRLRVIEFDRARSMHRALHDPLTGLPNRRLLMERLSQAVARDQRYSTYAAVLFIDLDAFKPVNDTHGHVFGDKLLKCIADRLLEEVRDTDTVARLGGDEFVVLLEDLATPGMADELVERMLQRFEAPCQVEGIAVQVALSIGCALHPRDGRTSHELLQAADKAMYRMKQDRGRR